MAGQDNQTTTLSNQINMLNYTIVTNPFEEPRVTKGFIAYQLKSDREFSEGYAYLNQTYPNPFEWKWKCIGRNFLVFRLQQDNEEEESSEEESSEEE